MALHQEKEAVLLNWINSLRLAETVDSIFLLKDCNLLLKLICRLDGQEAQCLQDQPIQERVEFVSDYLQRRCRYKAERGSIVSWDNILNGENLDIELSKVVVLLMYHVIMNELLEKDKLDQETEFQMAAFLRFVLDNENSLHLSDNLDEFLKNPFNGMHSGTTVTSFTDENTPVLKRGRKSEVKFLELMTVASSSAGSPTQEVLSTPQLQLKKLREQLAEERDARDELERDLANSSQLVTEREMQISQLQSRLQKLMQDRAEQDQEPNELEELQNKNEGLLTRLHEVLKQCQELKTDKGQMEKKIDQLTEENGNLSVEIRDAVARLSSVQMAVDSLSQEQQASHAEWESKKKLLETELCQAVSEKDIFSAQIQILQGKICVLEDELRDAQAQTREQGEVMGPIMEWERQNLEVSELTSKLSQLEETILQLEKEKGEMQTRHLMEKTRTESETPHLHGLVSELQGALCVLQGDKEALEQTSKEQQEALTVRISAMNAEIACLSEIIRQEKLEVTTLRQQVAEEQKQKGISMEKMEEQDKMNVQTIQALKQEVEHLKAALKSNEEDSIHQKTTLQEALECAVQEKSAVMTEYHQFRQEKDVVVLNLNQQIRQQEEQWEIEHRLLSEITREKEELNLKLKSIDSTCRDLQNELDVENQKHRDTVAAKLQEQEGILMEKMEEQDKMNVQTIQALKQEVEHLKTALKSKEEDSIHQQATLQEALECAVQEKSTVMTEYHQFRQEKEEKVLNLNQQIREQEKQREMDHCLLSEMKREKEELNLKLTSIDSTRRDLQNKLDVENQKHRDTVAAKLQKHSQMESEITELGSQVQQLMRDIEQMAQQLNEAQKEKLNAESCAEELKVECRELSNALSAEREQNHHLLEEKEAEVEMLSAKVQTRTEEVEKLVKEAEQYLVDLEAIRMEKRNGESHLNSVLEKHKADICALRLELTEVQRLVKQKDVEKELLKNEISTKEEELKVQQERVLHLESEIAQMDELRQNLLEEERRHQMTREEADARNEEARLLRIAIDEKENKVSTLLQNIQALEDEVCGLQDAQRKQLMDHECSISELKHSSAEDQTQIREKVAAYEIQTQKVLSLQNELNLERERVVSLEDNLKSLKSDLGNQKILEQELREMTLKQKADLEKLQNQILLVQEEKRGAQSREVIATEKITMLDAEILSISSLANERKASLEQMKKEFAALSMEYSCLKEQDVKRRLLTDVDEKRPKETTEMIHRDVFSTSSPAPEDQNESNMQQMDMSSEKKLEMQQETEHLKQATDAIGSECTELEKAAQMQAQLLVASALASEKESELCSLRNEMQEKDNFHLQASEIHKAQRQELEEKISQLQVQLLEASSLASVREAELSSLHHKVKEMDNLRLHAAALEEAQHKELEEKVAHLQTQVLEASNLASERELELSSLQKEMKCKDSLKLKEGEMQAVQCRELEQKIMRLRDELECSSSLVIEKQQINAALKEELKERDRCLEGNAVKSQADKLHMKEMDETIANLKTQILGASTQKEDATKLQQQMVALRCANEELLSKREGFLKEQEVSHKLTEDLATQLKLAKEELSTLRPLKDMMAEISQLNTDLQEELSVKSEALEHYKAQVENAKVHYNGKKQQLQEANERIKFITTDLESGEQEVKTLKGQIEVLQVELDQARATEENLCLNVNSLQAQLDHADMQLQELKRIEKREEMKPRESVHQLVAEKVHNSGDSLHLSLDDSLNSIRIPSERKESSTPVVRSSERLQAKRLTRGGESLETLYFTPMNIRNAVDRKLESSINSLGELVLDSAKKSSSVRRRTTQVINITMTKKTPSSLETEFEDGSFYNLQSSQSFPNIACQRGRPFSLELSEEATSMDQLRHLPGYRRSAVHSAVPRRSISTFRVGAENEPDQSEDWMRIAELQARNQAYLPHLRSCYPVESQPLLGKPALPVTDDELRTGDPNETIRRASLIPGQLKDSLASHRLSMSQIRDSSLSRRETMLLADKVARETLQPKRCPSNALNTRAATHSLKRRSCEPQSPDTPEAKKLASCFPRPMTPKDRNDRRFAAHNGQNRPPSTPVERRQSSRFSIENTPKKNGKHSLLQKGIDKMRASTRKSPGSSRKIPRSAKSPCPGKSPRGEKPQRRSPRINSSKSPKIASSTRKIMNYRPRIKI